MSEHDVDVLIRDLRQVPKDVHKWVRVEVRIAGSDVVDRARLNATWSTRIPRATKLSVRFSKNGAGVRIVTSGRTAPHAIFYENDGRPGKFRHPLFGNRHHWYTQAARPYLGPAMDVEGRRAVRKIGEVVDRALLVNRFR